MGRIGRIVPLVALCVLVFLALPHTGRINETLTIHVSQAAQQYLQYYSTESPYRQRLNTIRPLDRVEHSKTLGVAQKIYVIHLAHREDRRAEMEKLERAMDLTFEWVNATDLHSQVVIDQMERVRWWRDRHRQDDGLPEDPTPIDFKWADDVDIRDGPLGVSGSDFWSNSLAKSPLMPLPPPPSPDERYQLMHIYDLEHFLEGTKMRPSAVACWDSHYRVLRKIAEGEAEVAIILEDDVDMQWDLEKQLRGMWDSLPDNWDVVMLGYCTGNEGSSPPLQGAPTLHPASGPLCTHAYAVNRRSSQHLVRRMRSEAFTHSRPVDWVINYLGPGHGGMRILNVFTIAPPLVVQTYETMSDIDDGAGMGRTQWLSDSAHERIALAEAEGIL